ncbi:uncharacterized protein SCHCODRAFT_02131391 [Schizophyllum commune H4-8]|uniref:uncharacterized protein n=1 Tax=Schizophyllum commune (strain H4-8 / FGSC 9210) TaxID=578458 RepID=UPI00215DD85B|nr:uncharacterized protein SCHCODRAFT_02131391 [Schizophyllum commune H4-8]KAI5885103.1 hypothetical protein SCHCODRAFT_02131391 [Schizophyllum commune H4-8]
MCCDDTSQRLRLQQHAYNNPRITPTPTDNDVQGAFEAENPGHSPTATMTPTIMPTGGLCVSLQPPLYTCQHKSTATICRNLPCASLRDSRIAQQRDKEEPNVTRGRSEERCVYNGMSHFQRRESQGKKSVARIVLSRRYNSPFCPPSPWSAPGNIAALAPLLSALVLAHHCLAYRGGADRNTPLAQSQLTAGLCIPISLHDFNRAPIRSYAH